MFGMISRYFADRAREEAIRRNITHAQRAVEPHRERQEAQKKRNADIAEIQARTGVDREEAKRILADYEDYAFYRDIPV